MARYAGFDTVQLRKPQRSSFDLSASSRLSARMGRLIPVLVQECVPSDSFSISTEMLVRLAPLVAPIYDQISVYVHYFFVPNRLLWEEWETFITGGRLGVGIDPLVAPIPPYFNVGGMLAAHPTLLDHSTLADYMGLPRFADVDSTAANWNPVNVDAMPFAAYQLCYFDYYRDRNFTSDELVFDFELPLPSGVVSVSDAADLINMKKRSYLHDYFTSALPFTQRGEEVLMPVQLGGHVPIYADPISSETSAVVSGIAQPGSVAVGYGITIQADTSLNGKLYVDGADFDGTTTSINDFRSAYALQVWLERNAIGGSRYPESTQAHFGVKPQDSRLQRPEYIGGGIVKVKISEVVSTAWANDGAADIPQANMAGHGIAYGNSNRAGYFCTEHGFIIGIMSIMNPPTYQTGLPRMFRRSSFLDYPWPSFAKLGEQEVHDWEIYCSPTSATPDGDGNYPLFGYQSRYADWKSSYDTNHGAFRDSLSFWTMTRTFSSQPVLSEAFNLFDDDTEDRIFAVSGGIDHFWIYLHNSIKVKRPLPYFGTPNTLGFGS
jgi:hypothetical protein